MIIRDIYYSLLILIQVFSLIKQTSSCPIPFNIQSKCRCAITEIGRVYIYCARKQLIAVPDFDNSNIIFDELVLSGNRISTVHKNAFNGLKLRKLEFQLNPLNSIERNAFIDLSNYLEELILSTTLLSSELKSSTFIEILSELPNLKRLFLRSFDLSNSFSISNAKIALTARKLTQLSLQSCSIKQIDDIDKFVSLFPNLERLDLSENHMEYFNIPLILSLKKLKILILSKNKIHHLNIQSTISSLTLHPSNSLVELDLSYNGIETIDEHIFEIISSQLEILNLRNNELVTEKHLTFLIHLYHLREFYFDYNRLESINQLYLPLNLKILSLKNNRLNYINLSILTRLGHLEKLYLSSNKLTQWSSTINNIFPSLEILELDRNYLSVISSLNAPKLKQLNLDENYLGNKIDKKIFSNLPSLERLQLRDNQIESIDINAFRNSRLQALDLTNNSFTLMPLLNNLNETLQILSLRLNQIRTIDKLTINSYQALLTFEIDKNPLDCDCHLYKIIQDLIRSKTKLTGQCQTPSNHRNISLIDLSDEQLSCHINTLSQNAFLMKIEPEPEPETTTTTLMMTFTTTIASTTTSMETPIHVDIVKELVEHTQEEELFLPIATTTAERTIVERIRISDLVITPIKNKTHVLIQWELHPLMNEEHLNDEHRRRINLKRHDISGFKLSLNSPIYKMSQLLDALQRNYTIDYIEEGEICLFLLRKIDYDKFCKQIQFFSTSLPTQTLKSSLILDSKSIQPFWHLNEPSKSILIGSILGILLVLILLLLIILLIKRCPSLLTCRLRASKYHQNNDSKSETLLVRPTPTNTIPWSPTSVPLASTQPYFYQPNHHQHPLHTRPISYQPSISTQCTCPTHYHSSGSSATDASASSNPEQNYHIYQEILNDDYKAQIISNNFRACRPLHIDTNSPPTSTSSNATTTTNPEQCQLCSLSVLV
ncbi:unnamed protein product [Rotaria socialis]|uniref:Uncharacterized protein n=1 Tax=Rotaria socialis TaxID=392032 RepID=A0A818C2G2_9BILA|nr:unnamed protein product [Rotaria socialis]CAF4095734.1 unnamed protein product [Rotaria socialis]